MYAIIRDRGRQYTVREGDKVDIDLRFASADEAAKAGNKVEFAEVLLLASGDEVHVGKPTVAQAKVTANVLEWQVKAKKFDVLKFRRRKGSQVKRGHRQKYTRITIEKIALDGRA